MSKEYYILLGGKKIPVTEELYYAYKRPEWREAKQAKVRAQKECSYDFMVENAFDGQVNRKQVLVDEVVADKLLLDELFKVLVELTNEERFLIGQLFYHNKSEREVAQETGLSKTGIHKQKERILAKLRNLIKIR